MIASVFLLAIAGLLASLYAFYVEQTSKNDATYKPLCDINDRISCSRVFKSPYGSLLGFSNALLGVGFYAVFAVLALLDQARLVFFMSTLGLGSTAFLAYILYFKIRSFCFVCTTIYIINIALFYYAIITPKP